MTCVGSGDHSEKIGIIESNMSGAMLCLLFFAAATTTEAAVSTVSIAKHLLTTTPQDTWPKYVYQSVTFNRDPTYFECGSVCLRDAANCNVFGMSGTACYLGSPDKTETVISAPAPAPLRMYLSEEYVLKAVAAFMVVREVTSKSWSRFVYKTVPVDNTVPGVKSCAIASATELQTCEMVFTDGRACYFANSATDGTSNPVPLTGTSWDVYIKPAFTTTTTTGIFSDTEIPTGDLVDSAWNKLVYRSYTGAEVNQTACKAMCAYDYMMTNGQRCHFTSYETASSTCHLGTLNSELAVLGTAASGVGLTVKLGALTADTFTTSNFGSSVPSHGSQVAQKFIIKSASGVAYTADTCATLCYTHAYAPLPCHFYVLDGTTCKLGNFLQSTSETMGNADATIYLSEKFVHTSNLTALKYGTTKTVEATLKPRIHHKVDTGITSLDHCATYCRVSFVATTKCNLFVYEAGVCYIGNMDKTDGTIAVPTSTVKAYYDLDYTTATVVATDYSLVQGETSPYWPRFIYKSLPADATVTTAENCANEYLFEAIAAEMIVAEGTNCHYGNSATTTGSLTLSGSSWDIYIKQTFMTAVTTDVFTKTTIPGADLTKSSWNKFVYRTQSSADQTTCRAMCVYDYENVNAHEKCHFNVLDDGTGNCHLGSYNYETTTLANLVSGKDLNFKLDAFTNTDGFMSSLFPNSAPSHGTVGQKFIFHSVSGITYTLSTCGAMCFMHSVSPNFCTFYILEGTKCLLGNLKNSTSHTMPASDYTAYFNERFLHNSSLSTTNYDNTQAAQNSWKLKVHHKVDTGITSLDHCAAYCRVSYVAATKCNLFVYDAGVCYLGNMAKTDGTIAVPSATMTAYFDLDVTSKAQVVADYILVEGETSPYWPRFIHTTLTAPSAVTTAEDCVNAFLFDAIAAEMIVPEGSKCHFGSSSTTTGSVTPTGSSWNIYIKQTFTTAVTNEVFTQTTIPHGDLTASTWNKFVYRTQATATQVTCTAMCIFDHENVNAHEKCHFNVLDDGSGNCHLGSLNYETTVLGSLVSGKDLVYRLGAFTSFDNFITNLFPNSASSHGTVAQKFIFHSVSGITYTEDTCAALCFMHTDSNNLCTFYIKEDSKCSLGNLEKSTSHSMTATGYTAYFNERRLHNTSLAANKYGTTKADEATWKPTMNHLQTGISSVDHCAAFCRVSYVNSLACNLFHHTGSNCYIGNFDKSDGTASVPGGTSDIHYDKDYTTPPTVATSYTLISGETSTYWQKFIYKTMTAPSAVSTAEDCANQFLFDAIKAEMVVAEGNNCHFGTAATSTGSLSLSGSSWDIYVKQTFSTSKTDGVFDTMVIPSGDLSGSSWNKYVYRTQSGSNSYTCTAMCAFDYNNVKADEHCHFTLLNGDTCYLGSFNYETTVMANPIGNLDLNFKRSAFNAEQITDKMFLWRMSTNYAAYKKYIFKSVSGVSHTAASCSALCFSHTVSSPACSFWVINGGTCMLGNLFETTAFSTSYSGTAYFNQRLLHNSTLEAAHFAKVSLLQMEWSAHAHYKTAGGDVASLSHCAAYCQLSYQISTLCQMFAYIGNICYLGNRAYTASTVSVPSGTSEVYISPTATTSDFNSLYVDQGVTAASTWTKNIFKTEDLSAMDSNLRLSACKIMCNFYKTAPICELYVLEDPKCHLGDTANGARTVASSTQNLRVYQIQVCPGKANLVFNDNRWAPYGTSLYVVVNTNKNINDAIAHCEGAYTGKNPHAGHLVYVKSRLIQLYLRCLVSYEREDGYGNADKNNYIGINPNNHGQWLDGTAVEYNNFCPGEPNGGGPGRIYMWGAKFDNDNYCWDDRGTTSDNYGYICEKDKALDKTGWTATASSYSSSSYNPSRAIDSATNTFWWQSSIRRYNWLQIDMQSSKSVKRVMYRHGLTAGDHRSGQRYIECRVGNTKTTDVGGGIVPPYSVPRIPHNSVCGTKGSGTPSNYEIWFTCPSVLNGRYITIQKYSSTSYWDVAEISVFDF